ncbi:threonine aldolase family protein [Angustibacter luteus]|uniref:Threonine aldolase family protein n=1 Tax=Angustibacter luteus TaxID=658456 RepID=A0ABW1JDN8_9ACTN
MPGPDDLKAVNERRLAARAQCTRFLQGRPHRTPREQLEALAASAEEPSSDFYAAGGDVTALEVEVAGLLGKPAAAFVPSGTMAQQCALRVWSDRTGHRAVGVHALSHLVVHEEAALEELHGIRMRELADGPSPLVADDLAGHPGPLGALVVELPLRDAGYLLPSWDELVALTGAARERGIAVHLDGARLWESQPFYGRDLAEIAALADTVYVSFYKGLGAPAGAALAGPSDVVDEVRQWRHRHGGTLFSSMPYAVAARAGLRDRLGQFAELHRLAGERAAAIGALEGVRVTPDPPHTNAFVIYADVEPQALREACIAFAEAEQVWVLDWATSAAVPGWSKVEFVVDVDHLDWSAEQAAARVGQVLDLARRG